MTRGTLLLFGGVVVLMVVARGVVVTWTGSHGDSQYQDERAELAVLAEEFATGTPEGSEVDRFRVLVERVTSEKDEELARYAWTRHLALDLVVAVLLLLVLLKASGRGRSKHIDGFAMTFHEH